MRNRNKEPIQYKDSFSDAVFAPEAPFIDTPNMKTAKSRKNGAIQQKKNSSQVKN